MSKKSKLLSKLLSKSESKNITFAELVQILKWLGFTHKNTVGSHHSYGLDCINEPVNIQADKSGKAKPYQVDQIRNIILKHNLTL